MPDENTDYGLPVPFYFKVEIAGMSAMGFSEASGFETTMSTVEIVEGGENSFVHRVPDRVKYSNLILKRGAKVEISSPLVSWCSNTLSEGINQTIEKKNVTLKLLDHSGNPSMTWIFEGAYPVRWKTADLNSMEESTVLIEEIELCYKKFSRS